MFLISTDKKSIVNMDAVSVIYIGSNETSIKVDYKSGNGSQIGKYNSAQECKIALSILSKKMKDERIVILEMPTAEMIKAELAKAETPWHHATGKKTKNHGGS